MSPPDEPKKPKWVKGGPSPNPGGKRRIQPGPIQPEIAIKKHVYNPTGKGGFKPGQSGNPAGKPKGKRHHATLIVEQLIDNQKELLVQKAVSMAMGGEASVMRALLDRLCPPRRERPISLDNMPKIETSKDLIEASAYLMRSVGDGELLPADAAALSVMLGNTAKAIEVAQIDERLKVIESMLAAKS